MYYQEYLSSLCERRQWPAPVFTPFRNRGGFICVARVNNREYQSDPGHESERLARENAAMHAYWRCQNFSRNDGTHALDSSRGYKVQGRPIAIGTERGSAYTDDSRSSGSRSGGSSPTSYGSFQPSSDSRRTSGSSTKSTRHRSGRYR